MDKGLNMYHKQEHMKSVLLSNKQEQTPCVYDAFLAVFRREIFEECTFLTTH